MGIRLAKETGTHSSILAWEVPWTEKPGRLQTIGSQRAGHHLATKTTIVNSTMMREKWSHLRLTIIQAYCKKTDTKDLEYLLPSCGVQIMVTAYNVCCQRTIQDKDF